MIDTSCFKAFEAAARTLNFTEAALKVAMTQSGISQHIAKLEKDLGVELFIRVGKKVHLSESGQKLLHFISKYNDEVDKLREDLNQEKTELEGTVKYSMPESCLLTPHFTLLLKDKARNFPGVGLSVFLNHSEEVIRQVLNCESDFGFVTKNIPNEELSYEDFCDEEYVLIAPRNLKDLKSSSWISYPGFDEISSKWLHDQKSLVKNLPPFRFTGETNGLKAVLLMVANGMGITVLPRQCVETFENSKDIRLVTSDFKTSKNRIYIVKLTHHHVPARVSTVIKVFRDMKKG
jgi:DNA-binding transcriptional LysR family regulator